MTEKIDYDKIKGLIDSGDDCICIDNASFFYLQAIAKTQLLILEKIDGYNND